jgi:hypothetical protein
MNKSIHAIEKPLTDSDISRGIRRRYIPAKDVIEELEKLKEPSMWKFPRAGGQDQYAGMPPAIRIIDVLIEKLTNPNY